MNLDQSQQFFVLLFVIDFQGVVAESFAQFCRMVPGFGHWGRSWQVVEHTLNRVMLIQIITDRKENRDPSIDVIKGIAILLMVYGHTFPFCREFIYLFHMSVFLIASGYCYSSNVSSLHDWGRYLVKKIKTLYLPYIICNTVYIVFTNIFIGLGIYTDIPDFLSLSIDFPVQQVLHNHVTLIDIFRNLIKAALFIKPSELGSPTWFLTSLFLLLLFFSGVQLCLSKIKRKYKMIIHIVIIILMIISAEYISRFNPAIPNVLKRLPCTYIAFVLGLILKKIKWKNIYSWGGWTNKFHHTCNFELLF